MKRNLSEALEQNNIGDRNKRAKIEHSKENNAFDTSALPKDLWSVITQYLGFSDVIFLRATSSTLYKWCKELKPFPKYFVLDQDKCMEYLVENGFTSLLDYVKNTLRFEWTPNLVTVAARSGQVSMLQHLVNNGFTLNDQLMLECTKHSCDLSMIKYLHENGVPWDSKTPQPFLPFMSGELTPMEHMAYHGHLDCIKYAMENGCTQRVINYTPSIECLDFAIQNGFAWQEVPAPEFQFSIKKNICEEAARLGDLTMLKYAHQKGAPLKQSVGHANRAGHLDCLVYAKESEPWTVINPCGSKTLECFKYLWEYNNSIFLEHFGHSRLMWPDQAKIGNVEILRYLLDNKFPLPDPRSFDYKRTVESSFSSIEMLKFMLDEAKVSLEYDDPYLHCIMHNNLEGLKLCFERNFLKESPSEIEAEVTRPTARTGLNFGPVTLILATPSNEPFIQQLMNKAVAARNVEILKLLWEKFPNKEGLDMANCLKGAARVSSPEVLDFLTQQGAQWTSEHLRLAAGFGNLPNMAYLTRIGCKWNDEECKSKNSLIVKYAREHGCKNFHKEEESTGTLNKIPMRMPYV